MIETPHTWPAEGSTAYYALRHCDVGQRQRLWQISTLVHELSTCLLDVSEPAVAEKKIHWWHEELASLFKQAPRHPASIAASPFILTLTAEQKPATLRSLLAILSAHSQEKFQNPLDWEGYRQQLMGDYKARLDLAWQALSGTHQGDRRHPEAAHSGQPVYFAGNSITQLDTSLATSAAAKQPPQTAGETASRSDQAFRQTEPAQQRNNDSSSVAEDGVDKLAIGIGLSHRLGRFHHLYHAGLPVWPDSVYQQHQLTPDQLLLKARRDQICDLQLEVIDSAIEALQEAAYSLLHKNFDKRTNQNETPSRRTLPQHDALADKNCRQATAIYTQLRIAQLKVWKKHRCNLLEQYRSLTPLRKFLISRRTRRALEKNL